MAEQNTLPGLLKQVEQLRKDVYELKRRKLPAIGKADAGTGFFSVDDGTYTYTIAAPNDPTDLGLGTTVLSMATYADAGFSPRCALFLDPVNGAFWYSNNGIIVSASGSPFSVTATTLTLTGGAGGTTITGSSGVSISASGGNRVTIGPILEVATAYVEMNEMTTPGAPGANKARLYLIDNGAGKTQLFALFNTGAAQLIAQQP